jgi:hypothetical protein
VERGEIDQKVNERAKHGTVVTVGKQIKKNIFNSDTSSNERE